MKKLLFTILVWIFRLVVTIMLIPPFVMLSIKLINPSLLETMRRFLLDIRRMPNWGAWLSLLGIVVLLLIIYAPVILRALTKSNNDSGE